MSAGAKEEEDPEGPLQPHRSPESEPVVSPVGTDTLRLRQLANTLRASTDQVGPCFLI